MRISGKPFITQRCICRTKWMQGIIEPVGLWRAETMIANRGYVGSSDLSPFQTHHGLPPSLPSLFHHLFLEQKTCKIWL